MKIYIIIIQVGVQNSCLRSPHASVTELLPNCPGPGKSTVNSSRGTDVCKYAATAEEHVAKMVICHFGFMEKVYEPLTESVHRQWRFALMHLHRERTFVAPIIAHFIHVTQTAHRLNGTKCFDMHTNCGNSKGIGT